MYNVKYNNLLDNIDTCDEKRIFLCISRFDVISQYVRLFCDKIKINLIRRQVDFSLGHKVISRMVFSLCHFCPFRIFSRCDCCLLRVFYSFHLRNVCTRSFLRNVNFTQYNPKSFLRRFH